MFFRSFNFVSRVVGRFPFATRSILLPFRFLEVYGEVSVLPIVFFFRDLDLPPFILQFRITRYFSTLRARFRGNSCSPGAGTPNKLSHYKILIFPISSQESLDFVAPFIAYFF